MNENMPNDVKLDEGQNGTVSFATEVIATIAGLAANEVEGVASMSTPSSAFADMFSRKNAKNYTKGVRIDLDGNKVNVDISIVVDYGSPIPEVAGNIQENVKKAIETMSGLDVSAVNVHVTAISFEREQQAAKALDEQQKKMLEQSEAEADAKEEEQSALAAEQTAEASAEEESDPDEDLDFEDEEDEILDDDFVDEETADEEAPAEEDAPEEQPVDEE